MHAGCTPGQRWSELQGSSRAASPITVEVPWKNACSVDRALRPYSFGERTSNGPCGPVRAQKNPAYRDVLYVEELIGPDTVNTMSLTTIVGFREHGEVRLSIEEQPKEAKAQLAALAEAGISYDQATRQLQEEGVQKFIDSFQKLFACIDKKRQVLQNEQGISRKV